MGESQYSASLQSASTRSFATIDQSLVTATPLKLYFLLVPLQAAAELAKQLKHMYILHLLIFNNGTQLATFYAITQPYIQLFTECTAESFAILAKKKLQAFVLQHQAFVADIYLLYNFFLMLIFQIISSVIVGALSKQVLVLLSSDPMIFQCEAYIMMALISSCITSSMGVYVEMTMDTEKEEFLSSLVKFMEVTITIIAFSISTFYRSDNTDCKTTYIILGLITIVAHIVSYGNQFFEIFRKKRNRMPIRINFANFKPFRGPLIPKILGQSILVLLQNISEPLLVLLVMVFTQQEYNAKLYYPDVAVLVFFYIRQLTKMGQSFQFAMRRFLDTFITSNLQMSLPSRVVYIITKGMIPHLVVSLIVVGIVYWLSVDVANIFFPRAIFSSDQYDVVKKLNQDANFAALSIFANIATPFVQSIVYTDENKFTKKIKIVMAVIEWLVVATCLCFYYLITTSYLFLNYYYMYQTSVGAANLVFYIIIVIRYLKMAKQYGTIDVLPNLQPENPAHASQSGRESRRNERQNASRDVIMDKNFEKLSSGKMDLDALFAMPSNNGTSNSVIFGESKSPSLGTTSKEDVGKAGTVKGENYNEIDLNADFVLQNRKSKK